MTDKPAFDRIRYEQPDPQIVRLVLARPETRNAQDRAMLYELDRAFQIAALDPAERRAIMAEPIKWRTRRLLEALPSAPAGSI
jgi:enoyl-CoA hydratase